MSNFKKQAPSRFGCGICKRRVCDRCVSCAHGVRAHRCICKACHDERFFDAHEAADTGYP
jgi:hypothetical protein